MNAKKTAALLGVFLVACARAALAAAPTLVHDPGSGNYIVSYDAYDENNQIRRDQAVFEPATQIAPRIDATVTANSEGAFSYSYVVANAAAGKQKIRSFDFAVSPATISVTSPAGWRYDVDRHDPIGGWSLSGSDSSFAVAPGKSLAFSLASKQLPGIDTARLAGQTGPENQSFPDEPGDDVEALLAPLNAKDFVPVMVVKPDFDPTGATTSSLIGRLAALKHDAAGQNWLGGRDFVEDLDDQLSRANKSLSRRHDSEARRSINRFIEMLERQWHEQQERRRGDADEKDGEKHGGGERFMNGNAYQLLKSNAQFVLSRLPAHRDEADDREKAHRNGSNDR